jgi:excisionase family DNA binding protein
MNPDTLKEHDAVDDFPKRLASGVLTLSEVATKLQVKPITVRRLIWKGVLPKVPHIRHVRVTQKALEKFLEGRGPAAV